VQFKIYLNFSRVVFYPGRKITAPSVGQEWVYSILFGQTTCHILELCEKIKEISLKALLWQAVKKQQLSLFFWRVLWRRELPTLQLILLMSCKLFCLKAGRMKEKQKKITDIYSKKLNHFCSLLGFGLM